MVDAYGNEVPSAPEPNLPPAGYKREEELTKRTDILEEEVDKRSENVLAIDPSKMEVDREIRYDLENGELDVTNKDPAFEYKWVQCEHPASNPARMVDALRYRSVTVDGVRYPTWQVVTGDMKEAAEKKTAIGTRKIGDCILMRCHKNTYEIIMREERRKRVNRQFGLDSQLVDLAMSVGTTAGEQAYINTGGQGANEMKVNMDEVLRTGNIPNIRR